jgi:hypothetical protein
MKFLHNGLRHNQKVSHNNKPASFPLQKQQQPFFADLLAGVVGALPSPSNVAIARAATMDGMD